MNRVILVRHAQALSNVGDLSLGNEGAVLTEVGLEQVRNDLRPTLASRYGIMPEKYKNPVLASTFVRPQQTAKAAGFTDIHVDPILDESGFEELLPDEDIFAKHISERWAPLETRERARQFLGKITARQFEYELCFTHGMFIASLLLELDNMGVKHSAEFTAKRGYIPLQASVMDIDLA